MNAPYQTPMANKVMPFISPNQEQVIVFTFSPCKVLIKIYLQSETLNSSLKISNKRNQWKENNCIWLNHPHKSNQFSYFKSRINNLNILFNNQMFLLL